MPKTTPTNVLRRGYLSVLLDDTPYVNVVHYSSEGLRDPNRTSAIKVTCIAVKQLMPGGETTKVFSLTKYPSDKELLNAFFLFAKDQVNVHGSKWIHWNMKNSIFGFQALEDRYRELSGSPYTIPMSLRLDLSKWLIETYGRKYAPDPRLPNIARINRINMQDFIAGSDEATAASEGRYASLENSTLRKVQVIHQLATLEKMGHLKTAQSLWRRQGLNFGERALSVASNPITVLALALLSILLGVFSVYQALAT